MMHTLKVTLKQHTPILHFQGDYAKEGASLRATEFKPKLDRYIIANYNGIIPIEWKVGTTNALNYKVKISTIGSNERSNNKPPMFFGRGKSSLKVNNQGNEEGRVIIDFFCYNERLLNHLQSINWNDFFLATNFGTRQSKGYGSFYPVEGISTPDDLIGRCIKIDNSVEYRVDSFFSPDFRNQESWLVIMGCVEDVYKCLRSGINEEGVYFKSLMFAYAKSKGQWWDKRIIKELFFNGELNKQRNDHDNRNNPDPLAEQPSVSTAQIYPMFRDNLGLASSENWEAYEIAIKKTSNDIARFKSPILFKPILVSGRWYVFLLHREIPQRLKKSRFNVVIKKKRDELGRIKTKTFERFSMAEYMNYIWSIDNFENYVEYDGRDAESRVDGIIADLKDLKNNYIPIKTEQNE